MSATATAQPSVDVPRLDEPPHGGGDPSEQVVRLLAGHVRRVRAALLARSLLWGGASGALASAVVAGLCWWWRASTWRSFAFAPLAVGVVAGLALGLWRRWSTLEVALFLDARLASHEAITAGLHVAEALRGQNTLSGQNSLSRQNTLSAGIARRALAWLALPAAHRVRPRALQAGQAAGLLGAGVALWFGGLTLPPEPPGKPASGAETVRLDHLEGMNAIVGLAETPPRDEAQGRRLEALARRARELRDEVSKGLPRREALARLAQIRDDIRSERGSRLAPAEDAAARTAAAALQRSDVTRRAAGAVASGDLVELDREMARLAMNAEEASRREAHDALAEAAREAERERASELAEALREQERLFAERSRRGEVLRKLARALSDHLGERGREALDRLEQSGDPRARAELLEALSEVLAELDDEQLARLADALEGALAEPQEGSPPDERRSVTGDEEDALLRALRDPRLRQQALEALRRLAREPPAAAARRQMDLDAAERGSGAAQRSLGLPLPSQAPKQAGRPGQQARAGQQSAGQPRQGNDHAPGPAPGGAPANDSPMGTTALVTAPELRAKASARLLPTGPMDHAGTGHRSAPPGAIATTPTVDALRAAAPEQVDAVERSRVPNEYRDQVRRYFTTP